MGTPIQSHRSTGTALIRVSTDPGTLPATADLDPADSNASLDWLGTVWSQPHVRDALSVASSVLASRIHAALTTALDPGDIASLVRSVASYLLRWSGRSTPFGLFAGVAPVTLADHCDVRPGEGERALARPDGRWLDALICTLEQHPDLLGRLDVVAHNAASIRGGRLVVPGRPAPDGLAPVELSLRASRPVLAAVGAAAEPITVNALADKLAAQFPQAGWEQITGLLTDLVERGVLLTALRAPMTDPDPLGHLIARLADAEDLPDIAHLTGELRTVAGDLTRHNHAPDGATARAVRTEVTGRMARIHQDVGPALAVDVRADVQVTLPACVVAAAQAAADVLIRLSPHPFGYPAWRQFHARFRARYGPGALVPVTDLVSDAGLGLPSGFTGSPLGKAPGGPLTHRDRVLLALAQQAAAAQQREVVLTRPLIKELTVGDHTDLTPPARVEVAFAIHAASTRDIDRGRFRIAVSAAPRPGASMVGRFAHLLNPGDSETLAASFAATGQALAAHLSFPPRRTRSLNVTRTRVLLPDVISIGEHHGPGHGLIPLADLAVGADSTHLYLVQVSTGRLIQPRVGHALESATNTPAIARFLAEVGHARCAVYGTFDWGAAQIMPYLPRLSAGRAILAPARWLLSAADMPGRGAPAHQWDRALAAWRTRWDPPARVLQIDGELRLPLDLDQPICRALLRAQLERSGRVQLREAPGPEDLAWIGRAHEIITPLRRTEAVHQHPAPEVSPRPRLTRPGDAPLPAHSPYLCVHLHAHPDRFDEVLAEHLPTLLKELESTARYWWFDRYADPYRPETEQYLRLYLRLDTAPQFPDAAAAVAGWAAGMRTQRLVSHLELATYQPHHGRFGFDTAMDAAEQVFAADSAAAVAQITTANTDHATAQAICAASMLRIAADFTGGEAWLVKQVPHEPGRLSPDLRARTLALADPVSGRDLLAAMPGGWAMLTAWDTRGTALRAYRTALIQSGYAVAPLRSLLHQHHVRALRVDAESELTVLRLARAAAQRHLAMANTP